VDGEAVVESQKGFDCLQHFLCVVLNLDNNNNTSFIMRHNAVGGYRGTGRTGR